MPTPIAPRTPVECFCTLIAWLNKAVVARMGGDRLSLSVISLIIDRLRGINQCFKRIAARVGDGTYAPRRFAGRDPTAKPPPRPPDKLPRTFGWLIPLVPDATGYRSQLEFLLRDPGFAALLAAAPASLGRPLRSLCWMLRVTPPELLAPPKRPRKPPKPREPRPPRPPPLPPPRPPPTPPEAPAWMHGMPRSARWPTGRARAPRNPA